MSKTEVILTENVIGLGAESDKVEVAAGYARNYLLPLSKAIPANVGNERYLAALQARREEREAAELSTMGQLKESLSDLALVIKMKTGEGGKIFGSVTSGMIVDELKTQFDVELDRKKINLPQAIRELGDHDVSLKLHTDIEGVLKVKVESENPLPGVEADEKGGGSEEKRSGPAS